VKHYFLGYDPGLNSAAALVGLDGTVLGVKSWREGTRSEVFDWIQAYGKPVFVVSDKKPMAKAVKKMAANYNTKAIGFDLKVEEKTGLTRGTPLENNHERDALAAAIYCYRQYKNKIEQLKRKGENEEKIVRVLQGERVVPYPERQKPEIIRKTTDFGGLFERLWKIEADRNRLKARVAELEGKGSEKPAEKRIDRGLERELSKEKKEKSRLRKQYALVMKGYKVVKETEDELFERDAVRLELVDKKHAEYLAGRKIGLVIYKEISKEAEALLDEKGIEKVPYAMVGLKSIEGILVIDSIKKGKSFEGIERIVREYKESRKG
jgi:uncharacterized protein